jgi:hypothetical protein
LLLLLLLLLCAVCNIYFDSSCCCSSLRARVSILLMSSLPIPHSSSRIFYCF